MRTLLFILFAFTIGLSQTILKPNRTAFWGAPPAGCGDLVSQNFDSYTSGDDLATVTGWFGAASNNREVSNTVANSGANSVKFTVVSSGYAPNKHGLGGQGTGDFFISFYLYVNNIAYSETFYFLSVRDSNASNHSQIAGRIFGGSTTYTLQYMTSTGAAATVLASMAKTTWYLVEILLNMDTDRQSWKVDNTQYVSAAIFAYGNSGESATHIELNNHSSGDGNLFYLDDICINTDTSDY